jgi:hypothetical protein
MDFEYLSQETAKRSFVGHLEFDQAKLVKLVKVRILGNAALPSQYQELLHHSET